MDNPYPAEITIAPDGNIYYINEKGYGKDKIEVLGINHMAYPENSDIDDMLFSEKTNKENKPMKTGKYKESVKRVKEDQRLFTTGGIARVLSKWQMRMIFFFKKRKH